MSTDVSLVWRGLHLGGGGDYLINELQGWLGLPGAGYDTASNPRGHGAGSTPGVQGPRVITTAGLILGAGGCRDVLLAELAAAMTPLPSTDTATEPLLITAGNRTGTVHAQLVTFTPDMSTDTWGSQVIGWLAQWRCPDPRVYGDPVTVTAALVAAVAGVTLPALLPMVLPAQPIGGRVSIINTGTDPEGSDAVYTVTGPLTGNVGVQNLTTNTTVIYALTLGAADFLVIDTHRGGAWLNGFAYRPPTPGSDVIAALRLAPGANLIQATGNPGVGSPAITVTTAPASW